MLELQSWLRTKHNLTIRLEGQSSTRLRCVQGSTHRLANFLTSHIRPSRERANWTCGCPFRIGEAHSSRMERNNDLEQQFNAEGDPFSRRPAVDDKDRASNPIVTERIEKVSEERFGSKMREFAGLPEKWRFECQCPIRPIVRGVVGSRDQIPGCDRTSGNPWMTASGRWELASCTKPSIGLGPARVGW